MVFDLASFDQSAVLAVYPPGIRKCWISLVSSKTEAHHILGRRPPRGFSRYAMSSLLNLAWLGHDVHAGPARDDYRIRDYLLEQAQKHVNTAVINGLYAWTDADEEFKRLRSAWLGRYGISRV